MSRSAQCQSQRRRRLIPVAHLIVRRRAHVARFEQEATERTEMESVLRLLSYLLLDWDSRHIRPDAEDLFSCVSWAHRLCSARTDQRGVFEERRTGNF